MRLERRGLRTVRGAAGTLVALGVFWAIGSVGACSTDPPEPFGETPDAAVDSLGPMFGDTSTIVSPAEDQYSPPLDAAPPLSCPGVAVPPEASTACVIDTSASCSSCAPWGYSCPTWSSPRFQDAQAGAAASFCLAHAPDAGGSLICCTRPECIASISDAGCEASTATHYACAGGAVPNGTCTWSGPSSPNDYCCQ